MSHYQDLCNELLANPRRWLVTGAAGFIGAAITEKLLSLGQGVVGLDNFVTGHRHNIDDVLAGTGPGSGTFELIEGDIRDAETCRRACQAVDHVIHQAALGAVPRSLEDPMSSHMANVNGFINMALATRDAGVRRMVYASSSSVYGDHPELPKVEDRIGRQLSPYAVTKRADELYASVFEDAYGLELTGLRYFNVFGRRQDPNGPYAAVIPRWIAILLEAESCQIHGDGEQSRDFCYIDNVVQANLLAATAPNRSETANIYNVGCGGRTTLNTLFTLLRDGLAESRPELADLAPEYADRRPGDVAHSQANIEKISRELGYEATHSIAEGIRETVAWFAGAPSPPVRS